MKKKTTKYVKDFYDDLIYSEEQQRFFSEKHADFNKDTVLEKITRKILSEESQIVSIPFYKRRWAVAASFLGILILSGYLLYLLTGKNKEEDVRWYVKRSTADEIDSITLEDGTKIWLNVNSTLRYPSHFNTKYREVVLNGEGYFEVAHNPKKPFTIHSGNLNTTVLGTSFDINAYSDNNVINITVRTGKVKVIDTAAAYSAYMLTPKQQVSFDKSDNKFSLKKDADLASSLGWQENKLIFENKALKDIIPLLNKRFNTIISVDSSLEHSQITADFENESLDDILQVLSVITDGGLIKKKGRYFLNK